jgi:catechol 2,3-dioxygenase-like lactoylglutathione lyase family enzyme
MTFIPSNFFGTDVSAIYHVGYVVENLNDAMGQFSEAIGARFVDHFVTTRYRDASNSIVTVELHTSFSLDGPTHIELIEAKPGSIWDIGSGPGLHHIGLWTDDVPAEAARLVRAGLTAVASSMDPDDESSPGYFSYHRNPQGNMIELVDINKQQGMRDWIGASAASA